MSNLTLALAHQQHHVKTRQHLLRTDQVRVGGRTTAPLAIVVPARERLDEVVLNLNVNTARVIPGVVGFVLCALRGTMVVRHRDGTWWAVVVHPGHGGPWWVMAVREGRFARRGTLHSPDEFSLPIGSVAPMLDPARHRL